MKKLIISILLFYYCCCTIEQCDDETDINKCNNIQIEYDGFYCFKAKLYDDNDSKCTVLPKDPDNQKIFWKLRDGFMKEMLSGYGKHLLDDYGEGEKEEELNIDEEFDKPKKESYNTNEIVETEKATISSKDKEILLSEKTCTYYYFGKYYYDLEKKGYPNITDKNTCFIANQFDDLKNLLDCGYATINFSFNNKDYSIRTCYLIPNDNMPKLFNEFYMKYIKSDLEEKDGSLYFIVDCIAGSCEGGYYDDENYDGDEDYDEEGSRRRRRRRRLSNLKYNIEVENKSGKKVKYSSDSSTFEVISNGQSNGQSNTQSNAQSNNNSYSKLNLNLLLLFLLFFGLF